MMTLNDIEAKDMPLSEVSKLHISVKANEGNLYIDARKWFKYPNLDHFVSSKKGLMLDLATWKQVIPLIQELIASNEKQT